MVPIKNGGWTHVLRRSKQLALFVLLKSKWWSKSSLCRKRSTRNGTKQRHHKQILNHQWDRQCVVIIQFILLTVNLPKSYCREPCVSNLFASRNRLSKPEQFVDIVWCCTAFIECTICIDLFVYFLCYYWYLNFYYGLHIMVIILISSIHYQLNFVVYGNMLTAWILYYIIFEI